MFFHFSSFSFIFYHFHSFFHFLCLFYFFFHSRSFSFIFFHFLSFSFIFLHCPSLSFIVFHCLSLSFIVFHCLCLGWVLKIWFFLGLNFVAISLDSSYVKKHFLGPSRDRALWALFSFFFLLFFLPFFCLFCCFFIFSFFFNIFCSFLHFLIFLMFLIFFFHFSEEKVFFLIVFLSNIFNCWRWYQSLTVSSVVGAPWRCGVLTTQGGIAGIGFGRLLGWEHASTHQSGVEAPRLLKRSLPRLYYCCWMVKLF